jgi:hypothetical protein
MINRKTGQVNEKYTGKMYPVDHSDKRDLKRDRSLGRLDLFLATFLISRTIDSGPGFFLVFMHISLRDFIIRKPSLKKYHEWSEFG